MKTGLVAAPLREGQRPGFLSLKDSIGFLTLPVKVTAVILSLSS